MYPSALSADRFGDRPGDPGPGRFRGFCFRKMGLAGAGTGWMDTWERLRTLWGAGPSWVAVIYADWERADAPPPERAGTGKRCSARPSV